jgi:hypothetical protein
MLRVRQLYKVKGYVVIYVLFFGILCITMVLIGFKLELERRANLKSIMKSTLIQSDKMKYKEFLFSLFRRSLLENDVTLEEESIKNYLEVNSSLFRIIYENSSMTYDKSKGLIAVAYPFDKYNNSIDYYSFSVDGDKLRFLIEHNEVKSK